MAGLVNVDEASLVVTLEDGQSIKRDGSTMIGQALPASVETLSDLVAIFEGTPVALNSKTSFVVTQTSILTSASIESSGVADSCTITVRRYTPAGGSRGGATVLGTISLVAADHNTDSTLSGWTKTLSAGDIIEFEVTSAPSSATILSITIGR